MNNIRALVRRPGMRYLTVGGIVYLFELAIIVLAQGYGATPAWAVAISFTLGTTVSFFLQKLLTFRDTRMHHRILLPQLIATSLLIAWNLCFSVALTKVLQRHLPAVVTRTLALGITTLWNFYLYKTRIFKIQDQELIG
jgi:putative flippase GtrA